MENSINLDDFKRIEHPLSRFIKDRVDLGFISRFTKRDNRKGYSANYICDCLNGHKPPSEILDADLRLLSQLLRNHPPKRGV